MTPTAAAEAVQAATTSPAITLPQIGTAIEGGTYAGLTITDGKLALLVLLPSSAVGVTWQEAKSWAEQIGGRLPTRQEQITLFENLKSEFDETWYWSGQQHEVHTDYAWNQYFDYGYQYGNRKSFAGRARAVRSIPI